MWLWILLIFELFGFINWGGCSPKPLAEDSHVFNDEFGKITDVRDDGAIISF